MSDKEFPSLLDVDYQKRLTESIRLHQKIRYLYNKGVLCKRDYRLFVEQIRRHLKVTILTYEGLGYE